MKYVLPILAIVALIAVGFGALLLSLCGGAIIKGGGIFGVGNPNGWWLVALGIAVIVGCGTGIVKIIQWLSRGQSSSADQANLEANPEDGPECK